ncbi:DUF3068 domain-containing protein [Corynebacterium sp. TAE3-ERU12]|uniref:DUF3068 domain-containing protein n=1 Tax=Corynebacterium sp. TAE3-ERU12 TaxID=2849491 RepID=UPI001C45D256|nr:DUF3068 domain-containing protein [Corynebacterium sp. TAE3-ERU12]MBV7294580.1 DUF3068 domain-containing protein [Corynebacterium sp. TAE3-ERU12]
MLSRGRVLSVLLIGIGVAFIVAAFAIPRVIDDEPKVPLNLQDTTLQLVAEDAVTAKVAPGGEVEEVTGPVRRQFHAQFIEPADEKTVTLRVGVSMTRITDQTTAEDPLDGLVNASVWTYTIDRLTGEATGPATISDQPLGVQQEVDMNGSWAKFPANVEQRNYPVFDYTLRQPVEAEFVGTEDREGVEVLHFTQTIAPTDISKRYQSVITQGEIDGTPVHLEYSGTRDWWVERTSGLVVDLAEDLDARWEDEDGQRVATAMKFDGRMPQTASTAALEQAADVADTPNTSVWAIVIGVIGAILALVGLFGVLRRESGDNGE